MRPDGTRLSAPEVVARLARPIPGETKKPMTDQQWEQLVNVPDNDPALDPASAPARRVPKWEKYWNLRYSLLGAFKTAEAQARIPFAGPMDAGGDPRTQYMLSFLSRKFGPVYVMRGRMPTFPDTYAGPGGRGAAVMPAAQTQYWSLVSCEAAPSPACCRWPCWLPARPTTRRFVTGRCRHVRTSCRRPRSGHSVHALSCPPHPRRSRGKGGKAPYARFR